MDNGWSLDQPLNPATLSLRQTDCYRSFHCVFKQQIASQVGARDVRKIRSRVQRCWNQPVIPLLLSAVQITEDSWETEEWDAIVGDNVEKRQLKSCVLDTGRVRCVVVKLMVTSCHRQNFCSHSVPRVCTAGEVRNKLCTCLVGGSKAAPLLVPAVAGASSFNVLLSTFSFFLAVSQLSIRASTLLPFAVSLTLLFSCGAPFQSGELNLNDTLTEKKSLSDLILLVSLFQRAGDMAGDFHWSVRDRDE